MTNKIATDSFFAVCRHWHAWLGIKPVGDEAARMFKWRVDSPGDYCTRCGGSTGHGEATESGCAECRDRDVRWDRLFRLNAYGGPTQQWIIEMKYRRAWAWANWFGCKLAQAIHIHNCFLDDDRVVVTYVPLHWRRRYLRGFDQSALMACTLASELNVPVARLLKRSRVTVRQSGVMSKADRAANVRGAFSLTNVDLSGWSVVLVDDVVTTGATAGECAKLLRRAGADRINIVCAAVTDLSHSRRTDTQSNDEY